MRKRLTAVLLSFVMACACLAPWHPQKAEAAFLQEYIRQLQEEDTASSAVRPVIITLEAPALSEYAEAKRLGTGSFVQTAEGRRMYTALIEAQNRRLLELETLLGRALTPAYRYTAVLNGFVLHLTAAECAAVAAAAASSKGEAIYIVPEHTLSEKTDLRPDAAAGTLVPVGNDGRYGDGTGMVIAVIDTELDPEHEYFTMKEAGTGRLTKEAVDAVSEFLSVAEHRTGSYYFSEKIPYAVNYETYTADPGSENPELTHGTHVAGIAVGNGAGSAEGRYRINGNAPNAQLVFMGNSSLRIDTLLASFEDCLYLEVDVVNCSFGAEGVMLYGSPTELRLEQQAVARLTEAGIQVCVAAGNSDKYVFEGNASLSHPAYSIVSYPAALPQSLTVASAENLFSVRTVASAADGSVYPVAVHAGYDASALEGRTLAYTVIPGVGTAADFEGISVSGKYALVRRGEISFEEKSRNAAAAGAAGIIFYNHIAGGEVLSVSGSVLPGFFVSMEDGEALAALAEKELSVAVSVSYREGEPAVSPFTNWSATNLLTLKPDLMCFGGGIYSSVPGQSYQFMDGTSMAAPQAAGLYAVMKQNLVQRKAQYAVTDPAEYPALISRLLMSTARTVSDAENKVVISPRRQGSGIPNLEKALETPAYLYTDSAEDQYRPKISLGDDPGRTGCYSFSFYVKNISENAVNYTLSYDLISDAVSEDGALASQGRRLSGDVLFRDASGTEIRTLTVPPKTERRICVSIALSAEEQAYINRNFENGTYVEGYIYLKNGENPDLLLPFMGFYGSWLDSPVFDASLYEETEPFFDPTYLHANQIILGMNLMDLFRAAEEPFVSLPCFSPNGDGVFDSFEISITFLRPVYDLTIRIYNEAGAVVYTQEAGDASAWNLSSGRGFTQSVRWDGKDTDGLVHSGMRYRIELICRVLREEAAWVHTSLPLVVDTDAPAVLSLHSGITEEGTAAIYINAADDWEISGAMVIGPDGTPLSVSAKPTLRNGKYAMTLEAPTHTEAYTIELYDFAGNCTVLPAAMVTPSPAGDVTGDGAVDGKDVTLLLQYLAEWEISLNAAAADIDADGKITGADAALLLRRLTAHDRIPGAA